VPKHAPGKRWKERAERLGGLVLRLGVRGWSRGSAGRTPTGAPRAIRMAPGWGGSSSLFRSVRVLRPPGIEIPGYRRPSHPGLPWKPRDCLQPVGRQEVARRRKPRENKGFPVIHSPARGGRSSSPTPDLAEQRARTSRNSCRPWRGSGEIEMLPSPGLTPPGYFLPPCGLEESSQRPGCLNDSVRRVDADTGLAYDVSSEALRAT